jgi:hypothetical protein
MADDPYHKSEKKVKFHLAQINPEISNKVLASHADNGFFTWEVRFTADQP